MGILAGRRLLGGRVHPLGERQALALRVVGRRRVRRRRRAPPRRADRLPAAAAAHRAGAHGYARLFVEPWAVDLTLICRRDLQ